MNTNGPDNPNDRLEAYLDGALTEDARRAFERQAAENASLGEAAELQGRIDDSLRRVYEAPDVDAVLAGAKVSQRVQAPSLWRGQGMRVAAVLLLSAVALLAVTWAVKPYFVGNKPAAFHILGLELAYINLIADGYEPEWVCETEKEFAETYGYRLGQPLVLGALPPGVEALGLSYSPAISSDTIALLAMADGQAVVVFADHAHTVKNNLPMPPCEGLNLYSRRVGDMMLYEISPFDRPLLLDAYRLYEPEDGL